MRRPAAGSMCRANPPARKKRSISSRATPENLGRDAETRDVRALRLGELVHVRFRENDLVLRVDDETVRLLRRSVPARSCVSCAGAPRGDPRDPTRRCPEARCRRSPRCETLPSSAIAMRSMAPSRPGIPQSTPPPSNAGPAGHEAATMRSRFPTRSSVLVPMSITTETPGRVGEARREKTRRRVRADVASEKRKAVDLRFRVHGKPQSFRFRRESGRGPLARSQLVLGRGAIRLLAHRVHVEAEEEIPHRGVRGDRHLDDALGRERETFRWRGRGIREASSGGVVPCDACRSGCAP